MSDKLISLEAVVDLIDRSNADLIIKSERYELIEDIEALPPAELPMSAVDYLLERNRLCRTVAGCDVCPIFGEINWDCEMLEKEFPQKIAAIVEKWAKEHPEENSPNKIDYNIKESLRAEMEATK